MTLNNCALQSDTGRGVVVTSSATFNAINCTIHDCAATGLYVGDNSTKARILSCNIIRNGNGCRKINHGRLGRSLLLNNNLETREEPLLIPDMDFFQEDEPVVPPGHSGMYVTISFLFSESKLTANYFFSRFCIEGMWNQV